MTNPNVLGYKGTSPFDSGYFYAPYVPLHVANAIGNSALDVFIKAQIIGPEEFGETLEQKLVLCNVLGIMGIRDGLLYHMESPDLKPVFILDINVAKSAWSPIINDTIATDGEQWWALNKFNGKDYRNARTYRFKQYKLCQGDKDIIIKSLKEFAAAIPK